MRAIIVGFGAMSDPYMPLERELRQTRGALELLAAHGFGATVQTKSDLVMRDLDLLAEIHGKAKAVVQVTLTTYDEALCRILEPTCAPPPAGSRSWRHAGSEEFPRWFG